MTPEQRMSRPKSTYHLRLQAVRGQINAFLHGVEDEEEIEMLETIDRILERLLRRHP